MKSVSYISVALILLLVILVVGSWIVSVIFPESGLRSMLTETGIRWFIGRFTENMMTTVLVFMVLGSMAIGAIKESRILPAINSLCLRKPLEYRQRIGLQMSAVTLIVILMILGYCVFTPHALLLGSTGHVIPGPFAIGATPLLCLVLVILSIVYGSIAQHFRNITDIFSALCHGFTLTAPLFLLYILTMQLAYSCNYIFT